MSAAPLPSASAPAVKAVKKMPSPAQSMTGLTRFFWDDPVTVDVVPSGAALNARRARFLRIIFYESIAIIALTGILILGIPFFQPVYQYYALNDKSEALRLVPLDIPNMTNRAVLSWSTTAIADIMTLGFGDYLAHLRGQKLRFTDEGWESFSTAFDKQNIGEKFRQNQLVLTTVPSDTAVITAQGTNAKNIYEWHVQMPVIMTYATNNNVTIPRRVIISLVIIRVDPLQNPAGIAIQNWRLADS